VSRLLLRKISTNESSGAKHLKMDVIVFSLGDYFFNHFFQKFNDSAFDD
jgi:hypothetical protein